MDPDQTLYDQEASKTFHLTTKAGVFWCAWRFRVITFAVVAFVFNVSSTAKVIWRRGHGLKSHPTDWWSRESNLRPLVYKASGLSTTPQRLPNICCEYIKVPSLERCFWVFKAYVLTKQVEKNNKFWDNRLTLMMQWMSSSIYLWQTQIISLPKGELLWSYDVHPSDVCQQFALNNIPPKPLSRLSPKSAGIIVGWSPFKVGQII